MLRTALVTIAALLSAAPVQGPRVDLLIHNARIHTGVPASPWAEAIAISGDRIVGVGSNAELQRLPAVRTIDAAGRLVIPGINDAHTHPGASPLHTALEGPPAMMNDPSWTEMMEKEKGTLAPGMLADLAILSQDIFTIPTTELSGTTSVLTVVGGRVVHEVK